MSLCLFNLFRAADQYHAAPGWFFERCLTLTSGTKQSYEVGSLRFPAKRLSHTRCDASETSPCRRNGHSKTTARSPKGDGFTLANRRGNRDPRPSLLQHKAASAQLVVDSFVGPHRSPASPGVATLFSSGLISSRPPSSRSPARGLIQAKQGQACAAARPRGRTSNGSHASAVAGVAPVRRTAPRAGPVVTHQGPFICLFSSWGFWF